MDSSDAQVDGSGIGGVPATMLWTLRNRAVWSSGPNPILDDPLAVELHRTVLAPYDNFGKPSQSHPLRALAFDRVIAEFLNTHDDATVVALGEGLQTTYWRLGRPEVNWLSIDLPEVIDLRERLLPKEPRVRHVPASALDRSWMDAVPAGSPTIVSAEGLLMYFDPGDARALIVDCARRFPGGRMVFDSIPRWFSARTVKGMTLANGYVAPPMPFHLSVGEASRLPSLVTEIDSAQDVPLPAGRGLWRWAPQLTGSAFVRAGRPGITLLHFTG